jgi:hypothetical protein
LKNFSGGYIPGPPLKGREEREDGREKEGIRERKGRTEGEGGD